jgi:4-hydroxy-tetrahydrodipicolinate synthase
VLAAVPTPFDEHGAPDPAALKDHCQRLLRAGCHGIVVLGTTGEANSITVEERLELIHQLADDLSPASLVVGTGCCALPDTVRLTRAAVEVGAAGVLVLPPFYYKPPAVTDEGLFAAYSEVIEAVGDDRLRLYLYRFPKMTGLQMGLPLIERLHTTYPTVVRGLKDSSGNWDEMAAVLEALPRIELFAGSEEHLLPLLRAGGPGCISATVNLFPSEAARLHGAWQGPRADRLQQRLTGLRRIIQAHPLIPAVKAVLAGWNGDPGWARVRPPLRSLEPDAARELVDRLAAEGITGLGDSDLSMR